MSRSHTIDCYTGMKAGRRILQEHKPIHKGSHPVYLYANEITTIILTNIATGVHEFIRTIWHPFEKQTWHTTGYQVDGGYVHVFNDVYKPNINIVPFKDHHAIVIDEKERIPVDFVLNN
jgi:hypothetical protein